MAQKIGSSRSSQEWPRVTNFAQCCIAAEAVRIGKQVWIGYDAILETSYPWLITIEDGAAIGVRTTIIAHFRECQGVRIERDAFIGPGVLILPNVIIGQGAVVQAGSVVTRSVPPMTVVQGNPARPVAKCGIALKLGVSVKDFSRHLKPIGTPKLMRPQ